MSTAPAPRKSDDRLESWKAIADYFGKSQSCVRNWERVEGLPIHRQEHLKRGSIVAYKSELDAWRASRTTELLDAPVPLEAPAIRPRYWFVGAAGVLTLGCAVILIAAKPFVFTDSHESTVTSSPGSEEQISFSPDGMSFVYGKDGRAVLLEDGRGSVRTLREIPLVQPCCTRWSPDGKWIAIAEKDIAGSYRVVIVDPAGNARPGSPFPGGPELDWSFDSSALYFSQRVGAAPSKIYRYVLQDRAITQVTFPDASTWGDTCMGDSPDGEQFAFVRYGEMGKGDLYVQSRGSKIATRITNQRNWINGLDWLPDNRSVIYAGISRADMGIFRVDAVSPGEPALLPFGRGDHLNPRVTSRPDGSHRIAFERRSWNTEIALLQPQSKTSVLVAPATQADETPAISESGRVVFHSNRAGGANLWLCDYPCARARQLTFSEENYVPMTPRWSPDESRIVFTARHKGLPSIWVIGADGQGLRLLSTGFDEGSPAWSADGKSIFFRSNRGGRSEIWSMAVDADSAPRQITTGGGVEVFAAQDGETIYYTKANDNSPLIRRSLTSGVESVVPGLPPMITHRWVIVGSEIYFFNALPNKRGVDIVRGNLLSGAKEVLARDVRSPVGIGANRSGTVVYGSLAAIESDVMALDTTIVRWPFTIFR